jgi:hypothetical protein
VSTYGSEGALVGNRQGHPARCLEPDHNQLLDGAVADAPGLTTGLISPPRARSLTVRRASARHMPPRDERWADVAGRSSAAAAVARIRPRAAIGRLWAFIVGSGSWSGGARVTLVIRRPEAPRNPRPAGDKLGHDRREGYNRASARAAL